MMKLFSLAICMLCANEDMNVADAQRYVINTEQSLSTELESASPEKANAMNIVEAQNQTVNIKSKLYNIFIADSKYAWDLEAALNDTQSSKHKRFCVYAFKNIAVIVIVILGLLTCDEYIYSDDLYKANARHVISIVLMLLTLYIPYRFNVMMYNHGYKTFGVLNKHLLALSFAFSVLYQIIKYI